jgi:hypothetical protein
LQLQDVDLVLRNKRWHHSLRLDATPPEGWGQRFTVMGNFKEPLLSVHEGRLERWSGQAYLDFTHIDLSHLGQYLGPQDWKLQQGKGLGQGLAGCGARPARGRGGRCRGTGAATSMAGQT